jgi:hypothetical protein
MAAFDYREASWSAVAEMPGPPGIDDTAVERRKDVLRPRYTVRHATAVSRQGLPPHSTTLPRISTIND